MNWKNYKKKPQTPETNILEGMDEWTLSCLQITIEPKSTEKSLEALGAFDKDVEITPEVQKRMNEIFRLLREEGGFKTEDGWE
jgi:hypothetical protein